VESFKLRESGVLQVTNPETKTLSPVLKVTKPANFAPTLYCEFPGPVGNESLIPCSEISRTASFSPRVSKKGAEFGSYSILKNSLRFSAIIFLGSK